MDYKDTLKDLYFDGKPSGYREFRRKLILGVASLEDKQQHLAGPRVLGRLSGEAWKATENIPIADLRCEQGWLQIVRTLDQHYRYLPETELHEAIDEFLFGLKRKGHEGGHFLHIPVQNKSASPGNAHLTGASVVQEATEVRSRRRKEKGRLE